MPEHERKNDHMFDTFDFTMPLTRRSHSPLLILCSYLRANFTKLNAPLKLFCVDGLSLDDVRQPIIHVLLLADVIGPARDKVLLQKHLC